MKPSHRQYSTGFYFGETDKQIYESSSYIREYDIIGVVKEYDEQNNIATIEQKNRVFNEDIVEVLRPEGDSFEVSLKGMRNKNGESIEAARNAEMIFTVITDIKLRAKDILIKSRK